MRVIPIFVLFFMLTFSVYCIGQQATANAMKLEKTAGLSVAEQLAQQQLDAYNARDIDAFLEPYAEDVEVYSFPGELQYTGKDNMRERYAKMFERTPDLHCKLVNRIVEGNTVIDHENVTFQKGSPTLKAIAIYKVEKGKIKQVYFIQ
ncbi:MAG: nuclear transport factor 2 family protein [Bacteroidota bacterium]